MLLHVSFEWQQKNVNMEMYVHKPAGHTAAELDLVRKSGCGRRGEGRRTIDSTWSIL